MLQPFAKNKECRDPLNDRGGIDHFTIEFGSVNP